METDKLKSRDEIMPIIMILDLSVDEVILVNFYQKSNHGGNPKFA